MSTDAELPGTPTSMLPRMAPARLDKWCDNLVRILRLSLLAAASILVVSYNVGQKYGKLQQRAIPLELGDNLFLGHDARRRFDYVCYCRDALKRGITSLDFPFGSFVRDELHPRSPDGDKVVQKIFNDVSKAALDHILVPMDEVENELKTDPRYADLFAFSAGMPVQLDSQLSVTAAHATLTTNRMLRFIDATEIEGLSPRLLSFFFDPNNPPVLAEFHADGTHHEVQSGAGRAYERDSDPRQRADVFDLKDRRPLVGFPEPRRMFHDPQCRLIDRRMLESKTHFQIQLRYSISRPSISEANAYEDAMVFPEEYRWPKQKEDWDSGIRVHFNRYGDIYVTARVPVVTADVLGPLNWLKGTKSSFDLYEDDAARVATADWSQIMQGEPSESYQSALAANRKEIREAFETAKVELLKLSLPISMALLFAGILTIVWYFGAISHSRRLQMETRHGSEFLREHVESLFHTGWSGVISRAFWSLAPFGMIIISLAVLRPMLLKHNPMWWWGAVVLTTVAVALGISLFRELSRLANCGASTKPVSRPAGPATVA